MARVAEHYERVLSPVYAWMGVRGMVRLVGESD